MLRVDHASICATDLRILKGAHRKYGPGTVRVPGHEVVGTIVEFGRKLIATKSGSGYLSRQT